MFLFACSSSREPAYVAPDAPPIEYDLYHLPSVVDAHAFGLGADGTSRWAFDGCDARTRGESGLWQVEGEVRVLRPAPGATTFRWDRLDGDVDVARVDLREGDQPDEAIASGTFEGAPFEDVWVRGGICAVCGTPGFLGPSDLVPCDDPYLGE